MPHYPRLHGLPIFSGVFCSASKLTLKSCTQLCMCMFAVVIFAAVQEKQGSTRLGLLNTYKSLFSLDDSLADIKTINDLFEYLRMVSSQSRLIQPTSSEYFVETSGELKILKGVRSFDRAEPIEVAELAPRIDSPAFSFMAWIKLESGGGARIVRKPLGKTPTLRGLSCWSWYVGEPADHVKFGAHDCGRRDEEVEETVATNSSKVADGELHNVALVVTSTSVSFYTDAVLQARQALARPVTDCSGLELEIGDVATMLGELTFYARALTAEEMDEIMVSGFTLQSIAAGKLPYAPQETSFDDATSTSKQAFADAQSERKRADESLQVEGALTRQAFARAQAKPQEDLPPPWPKIAVPPQDSCGTVAAQGEDTSCHVMVLEEEDGQLDGTTGKDFFALIQPEYYPARADGLLVGPLDAMLLDHGYPAKYLRYASQ